MTADDSETVADRIVVRYAPAADRVREELDTDRYRAYLRRTEAGPVAPGDAWEGFVSCGCGSTQDVTLTVERVDGGDRLGDGTAIAFRPADESAEGATEAAASTER